ncbi:lipase secretion chaperone, partial [Klebsiella pneumoniae]
EIPQQAFQHWWQQQGDWVEEPNVRRGGESGVQRLLDEQRRERDWQQHYQAYRNELASLRGRGLSEADGEQLQRQLRERLFSSEDRHRVETYDAIAAKQPEPLDP